ncbi:MAG: DUF2442 domain-containing protein [Dehalococcoidia bacterium]
MEHPKYERATRVEVLRPYVIRVWFVDGTCREHDLEPELWGEVFEPLKDPIRFAEARIDPDFGTVEWPSGADLAPEFLYNSGTLVAPARV